MRSTRTQAAILRHGLGSALLGVGLVAALCSGCTSRTLPLPPPAVDDVSPPDADGFVTVQGRSLEGAAVGVMVSRVGDEGQDLHSGVIVTSPEIGCDDQCVFEARIQAESGEDLRLFQFYEASGEPGIAPVP